MQLIITEKPSVSRSIASVLGATQKREGHLEGNGYLVSWCAGHLLELAAPDAYGDYSKWRYADLPIIPDKWKHVAAKDKAAQLKILKELMKRPDVECVINACDAGREGENIFRLVYEYAKCNKKVKRLWISSLEDAAIKSGFNNLKDGKEYDNLYAAASCRERADWLVGISATRLFTVLYNTTMNTGRVQSPTLAMLVKREADINAFIKEPFYMPMIDLNSLIASGEKLKDKTAAEAIRAACDGKTAIVSSIEKQKKTTAPPKLYDLTALQREANRIYGFTAAQTLEYAQSLYEKAIISYPRVDSRYLTSDMRGTAGTIVDWMKNEMDADFIPDSEFSPRKPCGENGAEVRTKPMFAFLTAPPLFAGFSIDRLINDDKVSDHHAIIPTENISKTDISALPSGERDLLNLITVRLLCATAPVHIYEAVTAVLDCDGHLFTAKGKTVIEDGWKAIETAFKVSLKTKPDTDTDTDEIEGDAALPELSNGQTFDDITAVIKEGATTPPKHFTEDTLLSAMENAGAEDMKDITERKGLGTPATRAGIIEKLIKSGFVERQKKNLIPLDKGKHLIAILPETLTSPKLTAEWENALLMVQRGELAESVFMNDIAAFITAIVKDNDKPKPEYASLYGMKKSESKPLGLCPRCGAAIRESNKGFFCDTQSCGFKMWKESKFWTSKKKPLTAAIVAALLKDGHVELKNLFSEKTGKRYDATVVIDDNVNGYVNFKLNFENGRTRK